MEESRSPKAQIRISKTWKLDLEGGNLTLKLKKSGFGKKKTGSRRRKAELQRRKAEVLRWK
jgi:subtilase family serine protease